MTATSRFEIFIFFVLTIVAEILGTLGGFGSSLFFVPISQFFFDFQTALALTGLLHVFSNTAKVALFLKTIDWKVVWWLGGSSIVLAIAGAYLTKFVLLDFAGLALGVFLIVFSTFLFFNPEFSIAPTAKNSVLSGGVAGFLAGFIGTGGAVRGLALASFNLEKSFFVGTSAAIDFGVDLSRTFIYYENNYFSNIRVLYVPLLLIAAAVGSYFGKRILDKIDQAKFKKITMGLIFLTGVVLVVQYARIFFG